MADGMEFWFGFDYKDATPLFNHLNISGSPEEIFKSYYETDEYPIDEYMDTDAGKQLNKNLRTAWERSTAKLFWPFMGYNVNAKHRKPNDTSHPVLDTPWGLRECSVWGLSEYRDGEYEVEYKDAFIGVNLSARYFPTYLDMSSEHGTLDDCVIDDEFLKKIAIAKEELIYILPVFSNAKVRLLQIHY